MRQFKEGAKMEHITEIKDYCAGYKIYTLDVICSDLTEPAQLISSKDGQELEKDINALRNAILKRRRCKMQQCLKDDFEADFANGDIFAAVGIYERLLIEAQNKKASKMTLQDILKNRLKKEKDGAK